jgi:hypothetical protein
MPRRRFQAWRVWTHVDVTAGRSDRPPPPLNIRRQPCQTIFLARNAASISQAPKDPQHVTDTPPDPSPRAAQTDVHPVAIEVALAAALWFIAVTWVSFARGAEVDWDLVVVTLSFIFFFALFLFTASHALKDSRWRQRKTSFREFLDSEVGTDTGPMRGREVLLEIAVIPISLAFAATLIGVIWIAVH